MVWNTVIDRSTLVLTAPRPTSPAGPADPLGTLGKTRARGPAKRFPKSLKLRRRVAAAGLMPGSPTADCGRRLKRNIDQARILSRDDTGECYWAGLRTCHSVWFCAVCAAVIAERRRDELAAGVALWRSQDRALALITYTVSHGATDDLDETLARYLKAQSSMCASRAYKAWSSRWGVAGTVKALETTWGRANGWHPHRHELAFLCADSLDATLAKAELWPIWRRALEKQGFWASAAHGLDLQATYGAVDEYVAKWGRESADRAWGPEDELARSTVKAGRDTAEAGRRFSPFELLDWWSDDGDPEAGVLWREYVSAFQGRRQLVWSRGLRARLNLGKGATDGELGEMKRPGTTEVVRLSGDDLAVLDQFNAMDTVLELAEQGGAVAVRAFIEECRLEQVARLMRYRELSGGGRAPVPV